jgi:hypothetical protein
MTPQPSNWRHLAEQARNEKDPEKMLALVTELNRVLSEGREQMSAANDPRTKTI